MAAGMELFPTGFSHNILEMMNRVQDLDAIKRVTSKARCGEKLNL
jgi:TolB-like protein